MEERGGTTRQDITAIDGLKRALRLVRQAAPREILALVPLNLVYGAGPTLLLYVGKVVIDEVTRQMGGGPLGIWDQFAASRLPWAMLAFVILTFMLDAVETLRGLAIDNLRDRTTGEARRQLLFAVADLEDLSIFENPQALNSLQLADEGVGRLWRLATSIGRAVVGLFAFVPALAFTVGISWWAPFVLFLTALPAVVIQGRIEDRSWEVEKSQAQNVRHMNLTERILLSEIYAKEVRLFRLQDLLLHRWSSLFQTVFHTKRAVRTHGAWAVIGSSIVSAFGAFIPYAFVVFRALAGEYTLGDLSLYAGLIFQVRRSLELMIYEGAEVYQAALSVGPIFEVLNFRSQLSPVPGSSVRLATVRSGIHFRRVRFSYPGSDRPALDGIDLEIKPGEITLLVGENGAGKTTVVKLLCRLYDPDEGEITWDGRDLRSLDIQQLRERIAVVVQDYAHFPVCARENIGFGDLSKVDDDAALLAVAREAGLGNTIEELPRGLDTPLGRMLEGGTDLSGGQWQRLALARALLRQPKAELVVLDEPTAAIDPQSEHKVLETLRGMAHGKMALIVSHRLSLARFADLIVVLDGGRVVEKGSHAELMALGGLYHTMFTRQASSYV